MKLSQNSRRHLTIGERIELYRIGTIHAYYAASFTDGRNSKCSEAYENLKRARQLEPYRIQRDIAALNGLLAKMAADGELHVAQASALLQEKADFVDPIHPSPQGHAKIARLLRQTMIQ